jgi:hypothetical protein
MDKCLRIGGCTFFNGIMRSMPFSAVVFMEKYCHGQYETCARNLLIRLVEEKSYQISDALEAKIEKILPKLAPNQQEKVRRLFAS